MQENQTPNNFNDLKSENTYENRDSNNTIKKESSKKSTWKKELITFAVLIVFVVLPLRLFIAKPFLVNGASMYPTFETGDYLIVDQLSYKLHEPDRGDVVIFKFPLDESKFFIKRVIGLPGERVMIEGKDVFIETSDGNRFQLEEEFIELDVDSLQDTLLADDEYFVMGDNRLQSLDSRAWGPLKQEYIVGRAYLRLLPFSQTGFLPGKENY